jgi:diacylglycerol kinase family enzyme
VLRVRILLVVNSFASSVTARNTVIVQRALSRSHEVEVVETNRRGHATRFAADAARRGVDVAIGFGGDGTLNEVATGIAGTRTALGVLPGGSTNVFARTLGMPNDPVIAVHSLVAGLDAHDLRPIGLGRVNGRYFCFHTGIGFDAAVVRAVERRASLKRWLGHPLFMYAGLSTWIRGYDRTQPHFNLHACESELKPAQHCEDGYFSVVLNTNPYTYLGNRPLDLSADASLENRLVVITFRTLSATAIIGALITALKGGGVQPNEHLVEWTDVSELVVSSTMPFPYQLDGDYLGETTRLEFSHVPEAVQLVYPGELSPSSSEGLQR